jgi:hypothetical protein
MVMAMSWTAGRPPHTKDLERLARGAFVPGWHYFFVGVGRKEKPKTPPSQRGSTRERPAYPIRVALLCGDRSLCRSMVRLVAAPPMLAPMLRPQVLMLRGGDAAASGLVSIAANTLAMCLLTALMQTPIGKRECDRRQELIRTAVFGFLAYTMVYLICGFVPMGYVSGSRPLLSWLTPG